LHGPGDDVALAAGVLLVAQLTLGLPDSLGHDLPGGLGGDAPEVPGGDVELGAVGLAVLVDLLGVDADVEVGGVDRHPGVLVGSRHPLVGRLERVGQCGHQRVDRDALLGGKRLQRLHHLAHDPFSLFSSLLRLVERGVAGPHSNTVRARSMSW
jgi:hypothetical protein